MRAQVKERASPGPVTSISVNLSIPSQRFLLVHIYVHLLRALYQFWIIIIFFELVLNAKFRVSKTKVQRADKIYALFISIKFA